MRITPWDSLLPSSNPWLDEGIQRLLQLWSKGEQATSQAKSSLTFCGVLVSQAYKNTQTYRVAETYIKVLESVSGQDICGRAGIPTGGPRRSL